MIPPSDPQAPACLHSYHSLWKHSGGPAACIPALCTGLVHRGLRVSLATLSGDLATSVHRARQAGVRVVTYERTTRHTIWYSRDLGRAAADLVATHDLAHVHGMWLYPSWKFCREALRQGRPLVISPHGSILPPSLRKSGWKKWLATLFCDGPHVRQATLLHATSIPEMESIRRYGYRGPVACIPNGIDPPPATVVDRRPALRAEFEGRWPELRGKRVVLYFSRIEPIKGVSHLAHAWADLARLHPDWHLVIAGPDERGHLRQVTDVLAAGGVLDRTTVTGAIYDDAREGLFATADLLVLPTLSENFGMVIGEALGHGLPVLTTHGAPWSGIEEHGCGWWIPVGREPLTTTLAVALSRPAAALREMGDRGRAWICGEQTWDRVAHRMADAYDWLLGRSTRRPETIDV